MKNLRNRFERFCFRNRNKGIPNLMLYLCLGNALVYLFTISTRNPIIYQLLSFDRALILKGEIWRLFFYAITDFSSNFILMIIGLICYYSLGRAVENSWGTLKFNLFYLCGITLMDIFCMIFDGNAGIYYLNLSLLLAYATLYPQSHFTLFFIIPIKAWVLALFYLVITLLGVFAFPFSIGNLFPLVAIANYFLFFGKDIVNVFPISWRANASRLFRKKPKKAGPGKPIPFPTAGSYTASTATVRAPYNHRCTVCGRTDISDAALEFRYCSRCSGYYCYCEDHISNHTHIQ